MSASAYAFRQALLGAVLALVLAAPPNSCVASDETKYPHREVWIPLPDGVRLAADLYLPPQRTLNERHPVLLEYLPYRKTESRARNHRLYSYFIERGYAVARVDIRGTGNSEGRLVPHEYSDIEQKDGEAVIAWLSAQPWSNGKVGMFGISWGGFNAIQMAARQPPALKAIVAVDATEDLYQDDVHYMDGILHVDSWMMSQDLDNARPGAPGYVIDQAYFENRFDTEPWMLTYLRQQRDGPFWDRASTRDAYDRIRIPSFHIGGWYDGYRDSLPRMLENVQAPVKALIGPWSHAWPNEPYPEPGMEWRREAVRWFDQFLRGRDSGVLEEPRLAVYVRDWHPPGPYLPHAPGRWRWEDGWPIERSRKEVLYFGPDRRLSEQRPASAVHRLRNVPSNGVEGGGPVMWWGDVAPDQRPSDAFSLVYDSAPLAEPLEILGLPTARLQVSADAPRAHWVVRLSDVAPDGTVTLITGAAFNGAHRDSARQPAALVPGEWFPLDVELHFSSWVFPAGHRIRVAVGNAQWPMLWPTPEPLTTSLRLGGEDGARIELPVIPPGEWREPEFEPPAPSAELPGYAGVDLGSASGYGEISEITRNPATGEARVVATNRSATQYPWGREDFSERIEHATSDQEPWNTAVRGEYGIEVTLPERRLSWQAELDLRSDRENLHYRYTRRLFEDGKLVREKTWSETVPRDFQ